MARNLRLRWLSMIAADLLTQRVPGTGGLAVHGASCRVKRVSNLFARHPSKAHLEQPFLGVRERGQRATDINRTFIDPAPHGWLKTLRQLNKPAMPFRMTVPAAECSDHNPP